MKKKAQAAMEFLMTYGWAILVVLVVIGALAYFGVLSPKKLLPDKCLFGPGVGTCSDFAATSSDDKVILRLSNGFGETIYPTTPVTLAGTTKCSATGGSIDLVSGWAPGAIATVELTGCTYAQGDKTNEEVTITYRKEAAGSGLTHTVYGSVAVSVQ
jgi:hypothetical protein